MSTIHDGWILKIVPFVWGRVQIYNFNNSMPSYNALSPYQIFHTIHRNTDKQCVCLRAACRRDVEFSACRRVVYKVQLAW